MHSSHGRIARHLHPTAGSTNTSIRPRTRRTSFAQNTTASNASSTNASSTAAGAASQTRQSTLNTTAFNSSGQHNNTRHAQPGSLGLGLSSASHSISDQNSVFMTQQSKGSTASHSRLGKSRLVKKKLNSRSTAADANTSISNDTNTSLALPSTKSTHPDAASISNPTDSVLAVNDISTLVDQIRCWRDDALYQNQYDAAAFWGTKIVDMTAYKPHSITGHFIDVYQLALVYFQNEKYLQCEWLLKNRLLAGFTMWGGCLTAQCLIKQEKEEEALAVLGTDNMPCAVKKEYRSWKGVDISLSSIHGRNVKIDATVAYIRGLAQLHLNRNERAKKCFLDSLKIDYRSYQALDALLQNHLVSEKEMRDLPDLLELNNSNSQATEFVCTVYQSKINQFKLSAHPSQLKDNTLLLTRYNLLHSTDLLLADARKQHIMANYEAVLQITTNILRKDPYNMDCLLLYVSALLETGNTRKLFLKAHELAEMFPNKRVSMYAVATYYLSVKKYREAQAYFSSATTVSPTFVEAWIGFGHTFALHGIHDQAISSYSTASKISTHIHTPSLYLGMQYLSSNHLKFAMKFLKDAYLKCDYDPILLNELGVLYYRQGNYTEAIRYLEMVVKIIDGYGMQRQNWEMSLSNLGHAFRKKNDFESARFWFKAVLVSVPQHAPSFSALGIMAHIENKLHEAIDFYHQSLAVRPQDSISSELLRRALVEASLDTSDSFSSFLSASTAEVWDISDEALELKISEHHQDSLDDISGENSLSKQDQGAYYETPEHEEADDTERSSLVDVEDETLQLSQDDLAVNSSTPIPGARHPLSMALWNTDDQAPVRDGTSTRFMPMRNRFSVTTDDFGSSPFEYPLFSADLRQSNSDVLNFTDTPETLLATAVTRAELPHRLENSTIIYHTTRADITPPRVSRPIRGRLFGNESMTSRPAATLSSPISVEEASWPSLNVFDCTPQQRSQQSDAFLNGVGGASANESMDSDMDMDLDDNEM
ncbi:anaphase-promoting complex subunit Cut9 [Batrachochytrium dendrobatidis]|nr:anaphase-promoting complex subunit Cut9 [Batrachochytrium dendrobatidis]